MSLVAELKRCNVFRVGAAYLALAWGIVQITAPIVPVLGLPEWTTKFALWFGMLGFPCVLLFSWAYELTPEGLKRDSEVDRRQSITHLTAKRLDYITIALLVVAIAVTAFAWMMPRTTDVGAGHARDNAAE